jgi:hypothetical protein
MRTEFVEASSKKQALELMPWSAVIVKITGGYRGFESIDDYLIWKNNK